MDHALPAWPVIGYGAQDFDITKEPIVPWTWDEVIEHDETTYTGPRTTGAGLQGQSHYPDHPRALLDRNWTTHFIEPVTTHKPRKHGG